MIFSIICASVLCAVLYRMGGSGNYPRQMRLIGVPLVTTACLSYFYPWHWIYFLVLGLTIASISTYWDFLTKDKYDNFWLHGFMIGFSVFPLAIIEGHWLGFVLRCIFLALFMGIWCLVWDWDIAEECGRGAVIPLSLIFLIL